MEKLQKNNIIVISIKIKSAIINREESMLPKKRNKKILLISFILITIIIAEFYIKVKQQSQSLISEKKIFSMIEKASSLKEDTYGATTYYVSSDGVSQDGTDINKPRSFGAATKKIC